MVQRLLSIDTLGMNMKNIFYLATIVIAFYSIDIYAQEPRVKPDDSKKLGSAIIKPQDKKVTFAYIRDGDFFSNHKGH